MASEELSSNVKNDDTTESEATIEDPVLVDLCRLLSRDKSDSSSSLFDKSSTAVPIAAVQALLGVVQRSKSETMMGLQDELEQAYSLMKKNFYTAAPNQVGLFSGCEMFMKYVTRSFLELPDFEECRQAVLQRGERFQMWSLAARDRIAVCAADFVKEGSTVLTAGWSRVVASVLQQAAVQQGKHFNVIITEGRPDAAGVKAANCYSQETNIPVTVVLDSAVGYVMEKVDMVLVGAEGVLENGGVVNKLGTYCMAVCAKEAGKPFYVAAESYKFARLYPFHQADLPVSAYRPLDFVDTKIETKPATSDIPPSTSTTTKGNSKKTYENVSLDASVRVQNPPVDFTPAKYITLLFTDLGVLTPAAVSDELIRLYQ